MNATEFLEQVDQFMREQRFPRAVPIRGYSGGEEVYLLELPPEGFRFAHGEPAEDGIHIKYVIRDQEGRIVRESLAKLVQLTPDQTNQFMTKAVEWSKKNYPALLQQRLGVPSEEAREFDLFIKQVQLLASK